MKKASAKFQSSISLLVLACVLFLSGCEKQQPPRLTVNLRAAPIGIDSNPEFSWDAETKTQTAYQLQVATASDFSEGSVIWHTDKVTSSKDLRIPYQGPALKSASLYYWRVRVWDADGNEQPWKESTWETG